MISVGHHILSPFRERTGRPELAGLRRSNDCKRWRVWFVALKTGQRSLCAKCHVAEATSSRYKWGITHQMLICCFHMQKCARIQVLFVCFRFFVPMMGLNNLDHVCCLSPWIFQALSHWVTNWQDVIMIFEVLLGAASSYTFIYKLGHDFFAIFDPGCTFQQTSWFLYSC